MSFNDVMILSAWVIWIVALWQKDSFYKIVAAAAIFWSGMSRLGDSLGFGIILFALAGYIIFMVVYEPLMKVRIGLKKRGK